MAAARKTKTRPGTRKTAGPEPRTPTRDRLIRAARDIFASSGYKGATTKAIADRAGVAEVTLFRYFPAKKDLMTAVLQGFSSLEIFDDDFKAGLTWDLRSDLIDIAARFCRMTDESTEAMLALITEALRQPDLRKLIAAPPRRQREFLAWYLTEQIERGNCRDLPEVELAAQGFFALFFEYGISRRVYSAERYSTQEVIETFVDLYLCGISPGE